MTKNTKNFLILLMVLLMLFSMGMSVCAVETRYENGIVWIGKFPVVIGFEAVLNIFGIGNGNRRLEIGVGGPIGGYTTIFAYFYYAIEWVKSFFS